MSFIGVVFLFKPSTPSVNIDIGDKYYFTQNIKESNNSKSTNNNDYAPLIIAVLIFFGTYLFYSLAGKLMIFIIMVISLIKILRYWRLGIDYRFELVPPTASIVVFYLLKFII